MRSRTFLNVSLAILALAAAYHLGASVARAGGQRIVTRELVVTDEAGKERVTIRADLAGPQLSFLDEKGYPTTLLAGATLTSKSERISSGYGHGPYGGYLAFYDSGHTRRVAMGFRMEEGPDRWPTAEDQPGVALYDKDGQKTWSALPR